MGLALKGTPKWERPHPPKKWDPKNGRDPKKDPEMGATLKRTPKWGPKSGINPKKDAKMGLALKGTPKWDWP